MAMYYNGKKVRNLYYNGKCITRLALGKEMTRLVEGDDFVRAEWLKGDGFAYIDTNEVFESSDNILTRINITELPTNYFFIYGNDPSNYDYTLMSVLFSNSNVDFRPQRAFAYMPKGSYDILHNLDGVSINGTKVINLHKDYVYVDKSIYIFTSHYLGDAKINFHGDIAYFRITDPTFTIDRVNMFPCRLLRPIPASFDANGIARNAGECGMFDAVSGKFYGNVASSGAFTVEPSLVEGVDYERHKWLVGDGSAYIEGINYNLWDNTISLQIGKTNVRGNWYFAANYLSITEDMSSSPSYLMVIFRQNSDSIPHIADIDPYSSMPDVVTMNFYIENSLFYCNQNGIVKTNNPAQTAIESTWKSVTPLIYSMKMSYIREVLSNGTYRSNLIPVRLLRPLPSYLDANGKARHQFECGMLDLKTKKFYGNVNTSGNFTVSDN